MGFIASMETTRSAPAQAALAPNAWSELTVSAMTDPYLALRSPDWLAHRYDPGHDAVHFVRADRAERRIAPFLIDEHLAGHGQPLVVGRQDAVAAHAGAAKLNLIFHSAYCCSTLLANAYDRAGRSYALKEPVILNDLVGWRHRGAAPEQLKIVLNDALALLARPLETGEVGVIKPSNVVNGLAPAIMAARPEARALLLYAPLELFLGSIAQKGLWGRLWVRDLMSKQLVDGLIQFGFTAKDHLLQTDLQVAAVGWLAQHALFARLAQAWPDRVRTLDSETLLARAGDTLAAADRLFGIASDAAERERVVADVFARNAKSGEAFTAVDRRDNQVNAAAAYADELEKTEVWALAVAEKAGLPVKAPLPLLDLQKMGGLSAALRNGAVTSA